MRNVFSRRDFLKASAAAVLAASAAGVLTGCDGGGSEIPSATIGLGEFEVTVAADMVLTGDEVVGDVTMTADMGRDSKEDFGQNNLFYIYIPKVKIKYNGNGAIAIPFKDAFTAQITEKEVKPRNGSALIKSVDIPLGNTATYQPEFVFTVAEDGAFRAGGTLKLRVTLQSKTAEFILTSDGKVSASLVAEKA